MFIWKGWHKRSLLQWHLSQHFLRSPRLSCCRYFFSPLLLTCLLSLSAETTHPAHFPVVCLLVPYIGVSLLYVHRTWKLCDASNVGCVSSFPTHSLSPWGPSFPLTEKAADGSVWVINIIQLLNRLSGILTPRKSAHMQEMRSWNYSEEWFRKFHLKDFFLLIDASELAFSMGDWRITWQTCQHSLAVLWMDAQSRQSL